MKKQEADESSIYFKCDHCSQEFTLYSFRIAVFLYGIIFLADKHSGGYVGIVCPKCMKTTLRKVKRERLDEIKNDLGERMILITRRPKPIIDFGVKSRQPIDVYDGDIDIMSMERFNAKKWTSSRIRIYAPVSTLKYEDIRIWTYKDSVKDIWEDFESSFESFVPFMTIYDKQTLWPKLWNECPNHWQLTPEYYRNFEVCSMPVSVSPLVDSLSVIYWYKADCIDELVAVENELGLKMFPRLIYDSSIRTSCEKFREKTFYKFDFSQKVLNTNFIHMVDEFDPEQQLSLRFYFMQIFRDEDFLYVTRRTDEDILNTATDDPDKQLYSGIGQTLWNVKDPFKDTYVPKSRNEWFHYAKALELKQRNNVSIDHTGIVRKIWSNFTKDHVQKILSKMLFEFSLEFRELKNRKDCSTGAIWELKQKYLMDLYDSLSSPAKRRKIATQRPNVVRQEVKKAEEKFKGVKIISQDHQIDEIKIRIANQYVRPEKDRIDILILGETGTGKELIAEACHNASDRKGQFVSVNASAMPSIGLESELFGHARGAFTDAKTERNGKFKTANKGTIFLDEIGGIGIELQSKLLRVIENREIQPLGKDRTEKVDVILIMATNEDLEKCIEDGQFRKDLYYRITMGEVIFIPPLRDRKNDIPLLINHFIQKADWARKKESSLPKLQVSQDCQKVLKKMPWEGNVRELKGMVEKIVNNRLMENNRSEITEDDIPSQYLETPKSPSSKKTGSPKSRKSKTKLTPENIKKALRNNDGVIKNAAKELGYTREHLHRTMKKKGIDPKQFIKK